MTQIELMQQYQPEISHYSKEILIYSTTRIAHKKNSFIHKIVVTIEVVIEGAIQVCNEDTTANITLDLVYLAAWYRLLIVMYYSVCLFTFKLWTDRSRHVAQRFFFMNGKRSSLRYKVCWCLGSNEHILL